MNGGMLLEKKPRKSPKWKPIEIPEGPRSRSSESVTKWPRWLLPNTSSHSTGMGAKPVLIEGVIHRCSPLSEGGEADTSCFLHFLSARQLFFLGHEEKIQTGPQVNKRMNFITTKVRKSQSERTPQSSQMLARSQG